MMVRSVIASILCLWMSQVLAQDRKIRFPDIPGFITVITDLHTHSVFSDGSVWPDIRVREALFDGVDALAITEHLEYQPHHTDIPHPDRNRAYELAREYAAEQDLLIIPGAEITRSMPPGHANAIFIEDANRLLMADSVEVFREAKRQGAFVFWNHPNWSDQRSDGTATLTDMHRQLISEGLLDGIEVVNELTFSDEAMEIAEAHDLTMIGTSDIHGLIDWLFDIQGGGHRPVTLVFAREKTLEGIKEGLMEGRTVVWHKNNLIGDRQYLIPLVQNCLRVVDARYQEGKELLEVTLVNDSDARFVLKNHSDYRMHDQTDIVEMLPHATTHLTIKTLQRLDEIRLPFEVLNALQGPQDHPVIEIRLDLTRS